MKKILINRTDAIGDTLLTTSLARYLKEHDDQCQVIMLVSQRSGEFIRHCDGVDKVFVLDTRWSLFKQLKFLWHQVFCLDFQAYAHLGGSFVPTWVAAFKGVSLRTGILSKMSSYLLLNKGLRQSRSQVAKHEVAYNIEFAGVLLERPLVVHREQEDLRRYAPLLKMARDQSIAEQLPWSGPYVMVHPGMTGHTLNWPMGHYAALIAKIREFKPDIDVVVSHTPSDASYVNELLEELAQRDITPHQDSKLYLFDGSKRGLFHFAQVVQQAALFIGPSTGTTHIANALRVAQVAIYSPIKVQSSRRWGPAYRWDQCFVFEPKHHGDAMSSIAVEDVFQVCRRPLDQGVLS